jgi:hypothetical protein
MTPSSFTRAYVAHDLGGDLHRLAQRAAVVAAALYVAGLAVGVVIHWANDWLSGDRRPWPVAWGAAAAPRPRLREIYSRLAMKTETTMGTGTGKPVLIADKFNHYLWDANSLSVGKLRSIAKARGIALVCPGALKACIPVDQASRAELIAALQ